MTPYRNATMAQKMAHLVLVCSALKAGLFTGVENRRECVVTSGTSPAWAVQHSRELAVRRAKDHSRKVAKLLA